MKHWIFSAFLPAVFLWVSCQAPEEASVDMAWQQLSEVNWSVVQFGGEGATSLDDGVFSFGMGVELTGIRFEEVIPSVPYELEFSARKLMGNDFFCGLTFPVRSESECLTLILGGWGGGAVGISSIDGVAASENETSSYRTFETERWYEVRLVVTPTHIRVYLDSEKVVDFEIGNHQLALRSGPIDLCAPFGIATWQTASEVRNLRWRSLTD